MTNLQCPYCNNGHLGHGDLECVNGVMIDIDEFWEGWRQDFSYPPAPCSRCKSCDGNSFVSDLRGVLTECAACSGTGWKSGKDESYERLLAASDLRAENEAVAPLGRVASLEAENAALRQIIQRADDALFIEINPSNYDHDDVIALNDTVLEAGAILREVRAIPGDDA